MENESFFRPKGLMVIVDDDQKGGKLSFYVKNEKINELKEEEYDEFTELPITKRKNENDMYSSEQHLLE